ncbi:MAG: malonyl-ACP O-methyltransferase BioC [Gammaproteobacteria bacterium]
MSSDPFALDRPRVRSSFDAAAAGYDEAAILQAEVRARLLQRLDEVRLEPRVVVDAGCGTGHGARALADRYRKARVLALDAAGGMLRQARQRRGRWFRRPWLTCAEAEALPLPNRSAQLVFSNLMLQWCDDPDRVFTEFHRVLAPGGLLTFTTFGPDTLKELREAWGTVDGHTHVSRFVDMHDLGDSLVRAGFAEPVMDVEHLTMTYGSVRDLMRDLKAMGAHNATRGRGRGLTGRGRLAAVEAAYERHRRDGRLPSTWEVVYGHAWSTGRLPAPPGEARIDLSDIGRR